MQALCQGGGTGPPGAGPARPGRLGRVSAPTSSETSRGVEVVRPRGSRWLGLLPASTFLVGLGLGALVFSVDDEEPLPPVAAPADPSSPAPSASPSDLLVRVPEPCLAVAEQTEEAVAVVDRVIAAARSFNPRGLQEALDDVQELRPGLEQQARECRSRAGRDVVVGDTVTSAPAPGAAAPSPTATASPTGSR